MKLLEKEIYSVTGFYSIHCHVNYLYINYDACVSTFLFLCI